MCVCAPMCAYMHVCMCVHVHVYMCSHMVCVGVCHSCIGIINSFENHHISNDSADQWVCNLYSWVELAELHLWPRTTRIT